MLLVGSFVLSGQSGNRVTAVALTVSSALLLLYSLFIFFKRIYLIKTRATAGYAEWCGPVLIVALLIICQAHNGLLASGYLDDPNIPAPFTMRAQSSECSAWPVIMDTDLTSLTRYHAQGANAGAVTRATVREALRDVDVPGFAMNGGENSWQERQRVFTDSKLQPHVLISQPLGGTSKLTWLGRGSPRMPCDHFGSLELLKGCKKEEVLLRVDIDAHSHGLWEESVDLMALVPEIYEQLPSDMVSRPAMVASVVEFSGLEINNSSASVSLRMSQSSFELSLVLSSNPENDPAMHKIADQVWTALVDTLNVPPCSLRETGINV